MKLQICLVATIVLVAVLGFASSFKFTADDGSYHPDQSGRYVPVSSVRYPGVYGGYVGQLGQYRSGFNPYVNSGVYIDGNLRSRFGVISRNLPHNRGFTTAAAKGFYDNRNYGIIRKVEDVEQDGYRYLYETENGIVGEEHGKLVNRGTKDEVMKTTGYFSYTGPDNVVYTVRYTADENGFVPEGDHLPVSAQTILHSLEQQKK